jgi:hypothetical protein
MRAAFVPAKTGKEVTVSIPVLFVPFRGPRLPDRMRLLKRKRDGIWDNAGRNKLVVEVADKVARKPRKLLREFGVNPKAVRWAGRVRQRVALLVEGVEHAERLQRLLPNWELRHAIPIDHEPNDVEENVDEPTPLGVIATLVSAARYGVRCDILVRATGWTGRLDWNCITGVGGKATKPALLIDVLDRSDDRSRADSEAREQEYRQQGLRILEPEGVKQHT